MNELTRLLDKLGVKIVAKDMPSIPARTSAVRPWRVTLTRTIGRGKNAQELRLSTVMLAATTPITDDVVTCLLYDAKAADQKLWDFGQAFANGSTDEQTEKQHKACKKVGKRIKRFFDDEWANVVRAEQGLAPIAKVIKNERHLKKSA